MTESLFVNYICFYINFKIIISIYLMYTNISRKNTMNEVCINHSPNMAIEKFYDEEFYD